MSFEGKYIGRYHLLRLIGNGSMGEVYLAEDTQLNRQVAIKVSRAEATAYPDPLEVKEATRLFLREAKAIAQLDHPYILPLFDYGEENVNGTTLTYMVMPFRQEGTFSDWLHLRSNAGLLSWQEVIYFVQQAADALQHAHNRHITHQDVKPSNFLIRNTEKASGLPDLLLADFGIAKFIMATVGASHTIRGTPAYMAPEQWSGNPVPASDQYALAAIAYQLLTGRLPFQGGLQQVMYQHLQVQPQPPSALNPNLSPYVDVVLLRALAKRPEDRFVSISEFASTLKQSLSDSPGLYEPTIMHPHHGSPQSPVSGDDAPTFIKAPSTLGSDAIRITLPVSMAEALSGTIRTFMLPNGQQLSIAVPAGAYNGQVIRLNQTDSRGMTNTVFLTIAVSQAGEPGRGTNSSNAAQTISDIPLKREDAGKDRKIPKSLAILMAVLAVLVIAGSAALFYSYVLRANPANKTNTQVTQGTNHTTNTPVTGNTASTTTTNNPYPPYNGTLALNDPLTDNTRGYDWNDLVADTYTCKFTGGAYLVTQTKINSNTNYFTDCFAEHSGLNFSNFTYQVQVKIIEGDCGGVVFRSDPTEKKFYFFRICQGGSYDLKLFVDNTNATAQTLTSGVSPLIRTGLNQANLVAVVANNSEIRLYVNQQFVDSVSDSTYSSGKIAVAASQNGNPTEVVFNNAMVWMQ